MATEPRAGSGFFAFSVLKRHCSIQVCDGWKEEGLPVESGTGSHVAPTEPEVLPKDGFYLVTRQVIERLQNPGVVFVDTRASSERSVENRTIPRAGAIPGSVSIPWTSFLLPDESGIDTPEAIAQMAAANGLNAALEIVIYAQYGVDAALPWLALTSAGFLQTRIYDRGWVEWSNRAELPIDPIR